MVLCIKIFAKKNNNEKLILYLVINIEKNKFIFFIIGITLVKEK